MCVYVMATYSIRTLAGAGGLGPTARRYIYIRTQFARVQEPDAWRQRFVDTHIYLDREWNALNSHACRSRRLGADGCSRPTLAGSLTRVTPAPLRSAI